MNSRNSSRQKAVAIWIAAIAISMATGCQLMTSLTAAPKPTKAQSRLVDDILKSGGHFNEEAGVDPYEDTNGLPCESVPQRDTTNRTRRH